MNKGKFFFRIMLPNGSFGVFDLVIPTGKTSASYMDALEAKIIVESETGRMKLVPRGRGKDIPEHMYEELEEVFLDPVTRGEIIPEQHHIFGKGFFTQFEDKAGEKLLILLEAEVISKEEYWGNEQG